MLNYLTRNQSYLVLALPCNETKGLPCILHDEDEAASFITLNEMSFSPHHVKNKNHKELVKWCDWKQNGSEKRKGQV